MLQWGHGDEAVEEQTAIAAVPGLIDGFNGATAMKPWKRSGTRSIAAMRLDASMGPRR